jgi:putative aldouronate transport system permease protein
MGKAKTGGDRVLDAVLLAFMLLFSASIVLPFWSMLVDSFSTRESVLRPGLKILPRPATLQPYRDVFASPIVGTGYMNTVLRAAAGTVLTLACCFAAAYAVSKPRLPFRRSISIFLIATMFFGGGLIPTYLWYKQLGLVNTRWVLILPHAAVAYYIIIMRRFLEAVPSEIEESAFMDGAGAFKILFRIMVPLSMPVIATVGLWSVVFHWNAWFDAMIYDAKPAHTVLQLMLRRILIENQSSAMLNLDIEDEARMQRTEEAVKAATMFVSIGPVILVYPFIQKYFVKGIMVGAVKG